MLMAIGTVPRRNNRFGEVLDTCHEKTSTKSN